MILATVKFVDMYGEPYGNKIRALEFHAETLKLLNKKISDAEIFFTQKSGRVIRGVIVKNNLKEFAN